MNNEQKRFTVGKIEKYEKSSSQEQKNITKEAIFTGIMAIGTACNFMSMGSSNPLYPEWFGAMFGLATATMAIDGLKNMVMAISKKTGHDNMIEYLNYQLDINELGDKEESRGRRL